MRNDTFKREIRIDIPNDISMWVALTALIFRLESALKEVRGRVRGRRHVRMWATDQSILERTTVQAALFAMKEHGLTPEWCAAVAAVGPLFAERGRYEVVAAGLPDGSFYLRVTVSSAQKLNADALAATVHSYESELRADPKKLSEIELARIAEDRAKRSQIRKWFAVHGTSLAINVVSAIVGGIIATLVLVFGFGIR